MNSIVNIVVYHLLNLMKMNNKDYSMIIFFGITLIIFGGTILHEYLTERKGGGVIKRGDEWDEKI